MRRGLYLVLIVLTLLRGLAGPAMAAGMAGPHAMGTAAEMTTATVTAATQLSPHTSDHGDHGQPAAQTTPPAETDSGTDAPCHDAQITAATTTAASPHDPASTCSQPGTAHAACADCDICHTAVVTPTALRSPQGANAGTTPDLHSTQFASALPAQLTKPPIS